MAAFCCPKAALPLALLERRCQLGPPISASRPPGNQRPGVSVRAAGRLRTRSSVLVSSVGGYSRPAKVTGKSWDELILDSDTPVLVEFYASWCGPCRMVHRVIDEIATDYSGRLKVFILDTDKDPQVAEDYDIKAVPVVLLFKNGEKCDSVVGTMPKEFYVAAIERVLSS